jgi:hypothetical protein
MKEATVAIVRDKTDWSAPPRPTWYQVLACYHGVWRIAEYQSSRNWNEINYVRGRVIPELKARGYTAARIIEIPGEP